jgi:hypothetical protein
LKSWDFAGHLLQGGVRRSVLGALLVLNYLLDARAVMVVVLYLPSIAPSRFLIMFTTNCKKI